MHALVYQFAQQRTNFPLVETLEVNAIDTVRIIWPLFFKRRFFQELHTCLATHSEEVSVVFRIAPQITREEFSHSHQAHIQCKHVHIVKSAIDFSQLFKVEASELESVENLQYLKGCIGEFVSRLRLIECNDIASLLVAKNLLDGIECFTLSIRTLELTNEAV